MQDSPSFVVSTAKHSGIWGPLCLACVCLSGSHTKLCCAGDTCIPWNDAILVYLSFCLFSSANLGCKKMLHIAVIKSSLLFYSTTYSILF